MSISTGLLKQLGHGPSDQQSPPTFGEKVNHDGLGTRVGQSLLPLGGVLLADGDHVIGVQSCIIPAAGTARHL